MRFCQLTASQLISAAQKDGKILVFNSVIRECPQPSMAGPEKKLRNAARSSDQLKTPIPGTF